MSNPAPKQKLEPILALYNQGKYPQLIAAAKPLVIEYPNTPFLHNIMAATFVHLKDPKAAIASYKKLLTLQPNHADAWNNSGMMHLELGDYNQAATAFENTIKSKPDHPKAYSNLLSAYKLLGTPNKIEQICKDVLSKHPNLSPPAQALAQFYAQSDNTDEALKLIDAVISQSPNNIAAYLSKADIYVALDDLPSAIDLLQKQLDANSNQTLLYNKLAVILAKDGQLKASIDQFKKALKQDPTNLDALENLSSAYLKIQNLEAAETTCLNAIKVNPKSATSFKNLASIYLLTGQRQSAKNHILKSLKLQSHDTEAKNTYVRVLIDGRELYDARKALSQYIKETPNYAPFYISLSKIEMLENNKSAEIAAQNQALETDPSLDGLRLARNRNELNLGIWDNYAENQNLLRKPIERLGGLGPFGAICLTDDGQILRSIASAHCDTVRQTAKNPIPFKSAKLKRDKIKIGYFSADYHDHATMVLMKDLFEQHNLKEFEIQHFAFGPKTSPKTLDWLQKIGHSVFNFDTETDNEILKIARAENLDIAVDLKIYTDDARPSLFINRIAPIQINYVGYPGTSAMDEMDYIVVDRTLVPEDHQTLYSENAIYMPHSYLPASQSQIDKTSTTKADHGLPSDAFVFCSFNNNYKIGPNEFDIWMRCLTKIDRSVLWLLKSSEEFETNIRKEAENHGVDASRIIFAHSISHAAHLERHQHADLFLDTFNYNAHTTTVDAIWAGLPLVTKEGNSFAARVAASLLRSAGLPELITLSSDEYEELILELARAPERLKKIRTKILDTRKQMPLYDSLSYTRHLETAYKKAYSIYTEGHSPRAIYVNEKDGN